VRAIALPAPRGSGAEQTLSSIACPRRGDCLAIGTYSAGKHAPGGSMIAVERDGIWQKTQRVSLPGYTIQGIGSLSCLSSENCDAVLWYGNAPSGAILSEVHGKWRVSRIVLPRGLRTSGNRYALPKAVFCTSVGNCVVAGWSGWNGPGLPIVAVETNGRWGRAITVRLPRGASLAGANELRSIACSSPGNCLAVGDYEKQGSLATPAFAMAVSETHGVWGPAATVPAPAGATRYTSGARELPPPLVSMLFSVSCVPHGDCVAAGQYDVPTRGVEPMVATDHDGTWRSQPISLPANAVQHPATGFLLSIACTEPGCTAVGTYQTATASPTMATESGP
jgi:hypothetical protein